MPQPPGTTLIVDAPATYQPERRYILDVVMREWLGLDWMLRVGKRSDVRITLKDAADAGDIVLPDVLFATDQRDWLTQASLPPAPVRRTIANGARPSGALGPQRLPVLYGPADAAPTLIADDGDTVRIGVDVFGSAFFMLTRYEEVVVKSRDRYGRVPSWASVADAGGFLGLPIADAYTDLLWQALRRRWPGLTRRPRRFRVSVSHDVDRPLSFLGRSRRDLALQLGADLLLRRAPRLAVQRLWSWGRVRRGDYRRDPYNTFDFLMSVSERHGIAGAFYFLSTAEDSPQDGFYSVDDRWIRALMRRIHRRGHEVGFHAGFHTYRDPQRTKGEFDRLLAAATAAGVRQAHWGGRQHYLRWENPGTWANWEAAGLDYDSTLAFADRVGFRAGTCHEFPVFHLGERRPLRLRERPLVAMDGTLFTSMSLRPDAAANAVLDLARACRRHDGTLTLLWHNSSLPTVAQRRWYEALIDAVGNVT